MNMHKDTIAVLKNFATIHKCIKINSGNVLTIFNNTFPLFARAELQDVFPKSFSIYDLNQWLSTLSLFEDPEIEFFDKHMTISSGRMSAKYRYSAPSVTADQPSSSPDEQESLFSFDLRKEQLSELLKASSVLGLKEIEFSTNGIRCLNSDNSGNAIDNEYVTAIENLRFDDESVIKPIKVKVEVFKMLQVDYTVNISKKLVKFSNSEHKLDYYAGVIIK